MSFCFSLATVSHGLVEHTNHVIFFTIEGRKWRGLEILRLGSSYRDFIGVILGTDDLRRDYHVDYWWLVRHFGGCSSSEWHLLVHFSMREHVLSILMGVLLHSVFRATQMACDHSFWRQLRETVEISVLQERWLKLICEIVRAEVFLGAEETSELFIFIKDERDLSFER
jgi:hypothetical protein